MCSIIMDKDGDFQVSNFKNSLGYYYFRKVGPGQLEYKICNKIIQKPHLNIVQFYIVNSISLDMEILQTPISINCESQALKLITDMISARNYLLDNGIVYIDWKLDNIGWSETDNVFKLFDFDLAGTFNSETNKWIDEPDKLFAYKNAMKNEIFDPVGIDSFNFCKMVDTILLEH